MSYIVYGAAMVRREQLLRDGERHRLAATTRPKRDPASRPHNRPVLLRALLRATQIG